MPTEDVKTPLATDKTLKQLIDVVKNISLKSDIYNGLDSESSTRALSALQGKILNDNKFDKTNVYNGLDKTVSGFALDARQGKALNDSINAINDDITSIVTLLWTNQSPSSSFSSQTISLANLSNYDYILIEIDWSAAYPNSRIVQMFTYGISGTELGMLSIDRSESKVYGGYRQMAIDSNGIFLDTALLTVNGGYNNYGRDDIIIPRRVWGVKLP